MIEIPEKSNYKKYWIASVVAILVFSASAMALLGKESSGLSVEFVESVERSNIKIEVDTYGKLRTKKRVGLIAASKGNIEQMFLKPGAAVEKGDTILSLVNHKSQRALQREKLNLKAEKQELLKLSVEWEQRLKEQIANVSLAKAQLNLSKIDLLANKKLKEKNIISELDLEKSKVKSDKDKKVYEIEISKLESIEQISEATIEAAKLKLLQLESNVELLQADIDNLQIKSPMKGILMSLDDSLEIGKQINEGTFLGLVVDRETLYAELLISASKANLIQLNQTISLSIKGQQVTAKVSRISPLVDNGSVEVDAEIITALPDTAIPNIDVTGKINVFSLENTLNVKRPNHIVEPNKKYLIHVSPSGDANFELQEIQVGELTKDRMQILSPLPSKAHILANIPKQYRNKQTIHIGELND